jgi:hypothetical protein
MLALSQCRHRSCLVTIKESLIYLSLLNHYQIKDLATRTDNRPFRVFTGAAKDMESRKLGNTLRDVTRISDFITHKDTIDFLQVDHGQMKLILSPNPTHRPLELELARRCFYARSLFDTVRQLRYLHRVRSKV